MIGIVFAGTVVPSAFPQISQRSWASDPKWVLLSPFKLDFYRIPCSRALLHHTEILIENSFYVTNEFTLFFVGPWKVNFNWNPFPFLINVVQRSYKICFISIIKILTPFVRPPLRQSSVVLRNLGLFSCYLVNFL